jgi:dUTPase
MSLNQGLDKLGMKLLNETKTAVLYVEILYPKFREYYLKKKKRLEDAGFDVFVEISSDIKNPLPLGIKACMYNEENKPIMFFLQNRSSTYKWGMLANCNGVIDKGYRGELKAPFVQNDQGLLTPKLEILALFQIIRNSEKDFEVCILDEGTTLNDIDMIHGFDPIRKEDGFGSTG